MTTTTAATKAEGEEAKAKAKAKPFAPVTLKNLKPAPFYFDDQRAADRADRGIALKEPVKLDERQYRRRTPQQWGVLIANETIALFNVPEEDVEVIEAAKTAEENRLAAASTLSATERAVLAGKHAM